MGLGKPGETAPMSFHRLNHNFSPLNRNQKLVDFHPPLRRVPFISTLSAASDGGAGNAASAAFAADAQQPPDSAVATDLDPGLRGQADPGDWHLHGLHGPGHGGDSQGGDGGGVPG